MTPAPRHSEAVERSRGISGPWRVLLLGCAAAVTLAETLLLGAGTGFLTNGFNTAHIDTLALTLVFLPVSYVLDLWIVCLVWLLVIPALRWLRGSPLQVLVGAALAGVGIPVGLAAASYDLYSTFGRTFSVVVSSQFSDLGPSDLAGQALHELPHAAVIVALGLLGAAAILVVARRFESRRAAPVVDTPPPGTRSLLIGVLVLGALGAAPVIAAQTTTSDFRYGLNHKVGGGLAAELFDRLTDFDADGFGLLKRPADSAPFDGSIHPYAFDVPGNGVDENGVAGDHPAGYAPDEPAQEAVDPPGRRPHLLLVYLESFRADLLEARTADGREVTPFLNALAREGGASAHAYTHSPWTLDSRSQLLSGRIVSAPSTTTLVDDFQERGYAVAWFSGQDDSYGDSASQLGAERADVFYDARQDVTRRTSRSTAPVSLQVSWKTLTERIDEYLASPSDGRPLFLYANVVDTHYPYWHEEIDDVLGVAPLHRSQIRESNARHVRDAYANTAANVDRAVERIVRAFRLRVGDEPHAILVTADHGQALYDDGLLGHGHSLNADLTRVPFILWGIGGDWPEPIAPTHVRPLLLRHLGRGDQAVPKARFVTPPERRIFQYAPNLDRPRVIGLRGSEDRIEFHFDGSRLERVTAEGERVPLPPDEASERLTRLVWHWEALQHPPASLR